MTVKPDHWIRRMALEQHMIEPFEPALVRAGVISYGLSSYGYDTRLAADFRRPVPAEGVLDPKAVALPDGPAAFEPVTLPPDAPWLDLPPHSFVLGRTVEYFRIPANVLALCLGKSSYARCGVLVNTTPFEPGWEGYATLCLVNTGPRPVRLHPGEGIGQVIFFESDEACEVTYADRAGKYQAQHDITPTRLG